MKAASVLAATAGVASAKVSTKIASNAPLKATSRVGQKVLGRARRLEQENEEIDYTWVANMSLKFQGCYHTQQWNDEADGEDDVRISTLRLVRFRLCPSDTCAMESAAGCGSGYGDYVIGMEDYLEAYFEAVQQDQEYNCEYEEQNNMNCDNADDEEICQYDFYMAAGMEYCVDKNPYADDEEEEDDQWNDLGEMAECRDYNFDNGRKLKGGGRKLDEVEYFVGPYCSENGGSIHLGLFTEETCSQFADEYGGRETFASLSYGKSLPYSDTTMIGSECMSCKEPQDADQNNQNDQDDEDEVKESCEELYQMSGKCESALADSGYVAYPNEQACNFMQGIKMTFKNGTVVRGSDRQNTLASVFIGLFATGFVLAGGYVYYLKTKLERGKVNLSE